MAEEWKDIPGYEGKYQASTMGRIRSLDREIGVNYSGRTVKRTLRGRILRPGCFNKTGHVSVHIGDGSTSPVKSHPVHQLIALAFLGPRPEGMDICHNDGDPTNNAVSNLRYDTRTENNKDILRTGGRLAKLSLEDVDAIRDLYKNGATRSEISERFHISKGAATRIKTGRTFGWYKGNA